MHFAKHELEIDGLRLPKFSAVRQEGDMRFRELHMEEQLRLEEVCPEHLWHPTELMLSTGLREEDAVELKWTEVNSPANSISCFIKPGKWHTVSMTPRIREMIESLRGNHPVYVFTHILSRRTKRDGVWLEPGDRVRLKKKTYYRIMKTEVFPAAHIVDFTPHDFRHTAATRLLRVSNLVAVMMLLGHADIETTMRYTHITTTDVADNMVLAELMEQHAREETLQRLQGNPNAPVSSAQLAFAVNLKEEFERRLRTRALQSVGARPMPPVRRIRGEARAAQTADRPGPTTTRPNGPKRAAGAGRA
jgi:integrase